MSMHTEPERLINKTPAILCSSRMNTSSLSVEKEEGEGRGKFFYINLSFYYVVHYIYPICPNSLLRLYFSYAKSF